MKRFKFFLVAVAATAMMFSACKKDEDKNEEPEVNPTPVVINDDDLEKFDISNSQFGVTKTTTSSISVEWKEDEVKFDSVKIELKKLVTEVNEYGFGIGDTTFETIANAIITNDTKYTFEGLEASQAFDILFTFYSNKKICNRSYKALSEDSDKKLCDGNFKRLDVIELAGLKIAEYSNGGYYFYASKNAYGDPLVAENKLTIIYSGIKEVAYGYHLITNKEFEILEKYFGVTDEELANVKIDEFYSNKTVASDFVYDSGLRTTRFSLLYLNDDGLIYARYFDVYTGIIRFRDNYPTFSNDFAQIGEEGYMLFVKD